MLSAWICLHAPLLSPASEVLDLACGGGRHARFLLALGHRVTLVDRDTSRVDDLRCRDDALIITTDLEVDRWPLSASAFDAVVVTNYLYRPLFSSLLGSLRPGGLLLYETFAVGNERYGRPRNPDFLLQPGELLELVAADFHVLAFEDLEVDQPIPAVIQHIAARKHAS